MTDLLIPVLAAGLALFGLCRRVPVFDRFVAGAKEGGQSAVRLIPTLIGLLLAVNTLRASGLTDALAAWLAPLTARIGLPSEVLPLALLRPFSGSGSLALLKDGLTQYGPDSLTGKIACVLQASTETTFYTLAVYYGVTHVKKTRHTLPSALSADLAGFVCSALLVRLFFGAAG